jgi:hypothetical protein
VLKLGLCSGWQKTTAAAAAAAIGSQPLA